MTEPLATAIVALMGADSSYELQDLGSGRRAITLRHLPKPSSEDDPRFFRHSIDCEWDARDSTVEARGISESDEDEDTEEEVKDYGHGQLSSIGSVRGVASSTSVDFYGTEMSVAALEVMKSQLVSQRGVPLLPAHSNFFSVPEWDSVIGRSIAADIKRAKVAEPHEASEPGYILDVEFALIDVEKSRDLRDRLNAEQGIGLSIGGWFTAMSVIYNEETEELERIIVLGVELDHVAATRMPANPDSTGLTTIRSAIVRALEIPAPPTETHESRGSVRIGDTETLAKRVAQLVVEGRSGAAPAENTAPQDNQSSVTSGDLSTGDLDKDAQTGNDASMPSPAARSISNSTSDEPESSMTPEQIDALVKRAADKALEGAIPAFKNTVDESVRSVTSSIEERLVTLESDHAERSAPAPAPEPVVDTTEADALRAQITALQVANVRLSSKPVRRGRHGGGRVPAVGHGFGADSAFRSIVEECREGQQSMTLAAVVERNIEVLAEADGPAKVSGNGSVRNLQRLLASGLRAAEADGLINRPAVAAGWQ